MVRTTPLLLLIVSALLPQSLAASPRDDAAGRKAPAGTGSIERVRIDHQVFTLPNGLTTIVHTDRTVPSVFVGMWYRIGSRDEAPGRTGFAHLFEHLMFQGTKNRPGDYTAPLERAGATGINGMTDTDLTRYYQTVPTNALDLALWLEADRMNGLADAITQAGLDEQRRVVKNEKLQGELDPGAGIAEQMLRSYYPVGHPYAHTVIGSMDDLDRATLDDVKRWFADYYGASNAVLVLSGDIDIATARAKVTRYFGGARPGRPIDRATQWVPQFASIRRETVHANVPTAAITRRWPLANDDPRANILLQLLARTLAGSPAAFLNQRLVVQEQLAIGARASVTDNALDSIFQLDVTPKPGVDPAVLGRALDAALADYLRVGPAPARLASVATASDIALLRLGANRSELGMWIADGYVAQGDPLFFLKQRDWIGTATTGQLRSLAAAQLQRPYYEMTVLPTRPDERIAGATAAASPPMPVPARLQAKPAFPPITETMLPNGLKLVVAERHDLPMVDISLQFRTGMLADSAYAPGAAEQAFRLLQTGTARADAAQLRAEADRIGFSATGNAGAVTSAFNWNSLSDRLDASFALAAEMVRRPRYAQAEIDRARVNAAAATDAAGRNPVGAAASLFDQAIWGADHPFGRIATREDAGRLSRDAVVRFHDHEIGPDNATLYMMGDITPDAARALALRHFGDWKPVAATPLDRVPPPRGCEGRVILVDAPGTGQTSITAGHVVPPFDPDRAATEQLMVDALAAGFESRLNANLRTAKGWTYGISGGMTDIANGPRVFTVVAAVQTDRTAASMTEIRREIADFTGPRPITEAELDRDRSGAINAVPAAFPDGGAFLASMIGSAQRGLPYDRAAGAGDRLAAVQLTDVRRLAAATFRPAALTWVVVGDLARIEREVRALNLGPVEVWSAAGQRLR